MINNSFSVCPTLCNIRPKQQTPKQASIAIGQADSIAHVFLFVFIKTDVWEVLAEQTPQWDDTRDRLKIEDMQKFE